MAELIQDPPPGGRDWEPHYPVQLLGRNAVIAAVWAKRARRALSYIARISAEPARYREPSRFDVAMPAGEFFAHLYGLVPGRTASPSGVP